MATQKDIQVCINPHFDAVALWVGSFGGENSPCDISRGVFAAKRGVARLLDFFNHYGIKTTWGVTGHAMESFPRAAEMLAKAGHEIGVHGYMHENPLAMTREQETDVLERTIAVIKKITGKAPVGYMAPWWELSPNTIEILAGARYSLRQQPDGGRLSSALSSQRRHLDQDRLYQEGGNLDAAVEAGKAGRFG